MHRHTFHRTTLLAIAVATSAAMPAFAQSLPPIPASPAPTESRTEHDVQRDVNQQQRIENGLKSGALTDREAAHLEHQEAHIDQMEKHDTRNGSISSAEQQRLTAAQNRVSRDIHAADNNGAKGNPSGVSDQRLQADVQRNVNQQQRIENGLQSGQLNNRQTGQLEHGQAHDDRVEARAANNGHINANEQAHITRAENHQSKRIHNKKDAG